MKKYRGYLLVLLIAFCIQGCSKQQDVEDHSFVLAMGFERLNEKKVLVRYSYADFDKAQSDSGTKIPSRSVTFLATDRNLSDIFKKEDELSISFGEYLSKKLEIKDSKNLTLGRIYR